MTNLSPSRMADTLEDWARAMEAWDVHGAQRLKNAAKLIRFQQTQIIELAHEVKKNIQTEPIGGQGANG